MCEIIIKIELLCIDNICKQKKNFNYIRSDSIEVYRALIKLRALFANLFKQVRINEFSSSLTNARIAFNSCCFDPI